MTRKVLFSFVAMILLFACTPKTGEKTADTKPKPVQPKPVDAKNPCPTFKDAPNPDQALEDFVLYKDFMKAGDWQMAFEKWQKVHAEAPAADGKRSSVFTDGMKFYEHFMAEDTTKKAEYLDKIFKLYDQMEGCYPEGGYVTGLKAFDYFFKYPTLISKTEQYNLFKKSIDLDGGQPRFFILNPFTALLVDLTLDEKVPVTEAKKYQQIISNAISKGLAECKGDDCENWKIINEYAPVRLEALESIENFYDCAYYETKYYPEFQAAPTDCDVILKTYSRLKWGKCPDNNPRFAVVNDAYKKNCYIAPTSPVEECNVYLRDGKYRQAIECYEKLLPGMTDNRQKAQITLVIAKIYYGYLKNFPRARQYALDAARLRPGWGDPFILLGTLYASSGPLCGPGRGWESQVVVWPAIDMWQKARSVDPGVSSEANKLIGQYSQYMPGVEEIFQRGLKEGSSFYVGCWIQESTTIRAAK